MSFKIYFEWFPLLEILKYFYIYIYRRKFENFQFVEFCLPFFNQPVFVYSYQLTVAIFVSTKKTVVVKKKFVFNFYDNEFIFISDN